MALGGSYAARPGDFAAAYYNPAGLAPGGSALEKGGFFEASIALVYGHPSLFVMGAHGMSLPTHEVYDTAGAVIGSRFSVGQPFHIDGLDMGSARSSSRATSSSGRSRPDDKPQWALLTDRTQVLTIDVGLAYRVTRWLSLGAGLRVLFDVQTDINGVLTHINFVRRPRDGAARRRLHGVRPRRARRRCSSSRPWTACASASPTVARATSTTGGATIVSTGAQVGLGNLGYDFRFAHYFEPTEVTAAVSADLGAGVDVSADLTYGRWSDALSSNRNLYGCGVNPCDGSSPIWGDTWTPAFGVRWRATPAFALMAGYRFQKSPLDNFGGPSNLLDNDRHVPGTGIELDLSKLVPWLDARVKVGLAVRGARRPDRDEGVFSVPERGGVQEQSGISFLQLRRPPSGRLGGRGGAVVRGLGFAGLALVAVAAACGPDASNDTPLRDAASACLPGFCVEATPPPKNVDSGLGNAPLEPWREDRDTATSAGSSPRSPSSTRTWRPTRSPCGCSSGCASSRSARRRSSRTRSARSSSRAFRTWRRWSSPPCSRPSSRRTASRWRRGTT